MRDARFNHPTFRIAGGNGSRLFVASAMDWFKCDWEDREGCGLTKCSAAMAKSLPPFFYRSAPACAYLSTADESNVRVPSELRRSGFTTWFSRKRQSNPWHAAIIPL